MKLQGKDKLFLAVVVALAGIVGIFLIYKFSDLNNQETVLMLESYLQRVRGSHTRQDVSSDCEPLPPGILNHSVFNIWTEQNDITDFNFCRSGGQPLKALGSHGLTSEAKCLEAIAQSQGMGKYFPSPNEQKGICMGNFGEPDSYLELIDSAKESGEVLKICGTPCTYNTGFWLDDDRFVLLETDRIDGGNDEYLTGLYDLKNKTQTSWQATLSDFSDWEIYRNDKVDK